MRTSARVEYKLWHREATMQLLVQAKVTLLPDEGDLLTWLWQDFEEYFNEYGDGRLYTLYFFQQSLVYLDAWRQRDLTITLREIFSLCIVLGITESRDTRFKLTRIFDSNNSILDEERRNELKKTFYELCQWEVSPSASTMEVFMRQIYDLLTLSGYQAEFTVDMLEYKILSLNGQHPIWACMEEINPQVTDVLNAVYDALDAQGLVTVSRSDGHVLEAILNYASACITGIDGKTNYTENIAEAFIAYVRYYFMRFLTAVSQEDIDEFFKTIDLNDKLLATCINLIDKPYLRYEAFHDFIIGLVVLKPECLKQLPDIFQKIKSKYLIYPLLSDKELAVFVREAVQETMVDNPIEGYLEGIVSDAIFNYAMRNTLSHVTLFALTYCIAPVFGRRIEEKQVERCILAATACIGAVPREVNQLRKAINKELVSTYDPMPTDDSTSSALSVKLSVCNFIFSIGYFLYFANDSVEDTNDLSFHLLHGLLYNRYALCAFAGAMLYYEEEKLGEAVTAYWVGEHVLMHRYLGNFFTEKPITQKDYAITLLKQIIARRQREEFSFEVTESLGEKLKDLKIREKEIRKFPYESSFTFFAPPPPLPPPLPLESTLLLDDDFQTIDAVPMAQPPSSPTINLSLS